MQPDPISDLSFAGVSCGDVRSNKPFERPGANALRRTESASAGRSAPRHLVLALAVAVIQGTTFLLLLGEQIARAEHFGPVRYESRGLNVAVAIFSAPIFYLVRREWTFWLRPYLGDDLWMIVILTLANALCWGALAAGSMWWWRRWRRTASAI